MIPAILYKYLYLIIVALLTLVAMQIRRKPGVMENSISSMLLCVFVVLFIGLRPISPVFVDMLNYTQGWGYDFEEGINWNTENLLFDNLYFFMSNIGAPVESFFLLIAAIYFTCIYCACQKLFPNHILLSFLVYLAAFSTFSYGTNGIKAGAAGSLFLVALAYRDKMWISVLFLLLSWGFHHSMQLPVVAYILTLIFKNEKVYFYGWLFCLMMAIGHITFFQSFFAGFSDERGAAYLMSNSSDMWGGKSGFRIDFVIYSVMPVLMGYFVKYKYKLEDKLYDVILNIYLSLIHI